MVVQINTKVHYATGRKNDIYLKRKVAILSAHPGGRSVFLFYGNTSKKVKLIQNPKWIDFYKVLRAVLKILYFVLSFTLFCLFVCFGLKSCLIGEVFMTLKTHLPPVFTPCYAAVDFGPSTCCPFSWHWGVCAHLSDNIPQAE